jgi:hypothetical protein
MRPWDVHVRQYLTTAVKRDQLKPFANTPVVANLLGEKPVGLMGGEGMSQLLNDGGLANTWQTGEQDMPSHPIFFTCELSMKNAA